MTDERSGHDGAVSALLEERARYEEWLSALEQRRDSTPAHIYARVHADYSSRLQRVFEQLGAHRAAVEEMISGLLDRLTMLDIDEAKHRDERSEAELRGIIGEYTEEQCAAVIRRCDEEMAGVGAEKAGIAAEVARLRAVLDGSPATAASVPSPPRAPTPVEEQIVLDEEPVVDYGRQSEADRTDADAARRESEASTSGGARERDASFDELEFLRTVGDSGRPDNKGGPDHGQTGGHAQPPVRPAQEPADDQSGPDMRDSIPSFVKLSPSEQVKTLKCQECGTMNYPTEWYCERCGAELAAL